MKYSLIIVAYKAQEQLIKCLEALTRNPPLDAKSEAEIIIIDNSPERACDVPNKLLKPILKTYAQVILEWHPENLGFAAGCNRGVELSSGDNIVLINPDTEVFPEWCERMAGYLTEGIGAVGPISNFVAGWQQAGLHMRITESGEKTARYAIKGNHRRGVETKLLIGFFVMIPRQVWDNVGGLDPQFFLGCDDLDLSMRIREIGLKLVVATDVFVYHEGHSSFYAAGIKSLELTRQAEKKMLAKLQAKYGDNIPSSTELWGCEILPTVIGQRQKLSICMIVRDEAENLRELLPQLGFADEVVIVETIPGVNADLPDDYAARLIEIGAPELVGKVIAGVFPWADDFAAARNHALSLCTGDWVLWLDADDRVTPENAALIRVAMDYPGPMTMQKTVHFGFILRDHGPDGLNFAEGQPRLFPRLEGLKWAGRVHESYIPAAEALGVFKADCNIVIDHTGYKDPAVMLKKHARNLRLMRMEVDSPNKFYHMGKNLQALGHFMESEEYYRRVLETEWGAPLESPFRDQVRMCMASLIVTVRGAHESIDQYLEGNAKPDAMFLRAEVAFKRGFIFEAEAVYKEYAALEYIRDPHGSQMEYLQGIARGRLETIASARRKVYGEDATVDA